MQQRAMSFSFLAGTSIVTRLIASAATPALMRDNAWVPVWVGFISTILATVLSVSTHAEPGYLKPDSGSNSIAGYSVNRYGATPDGLQLNASPRGVVQAAIRHVSSMAGSIACNTQSPIIYLMLTLLTTTLGWHAQDVLIQFARKRYGWTWSAVRPVKLEFVTGRIRNHHRANSQYSRLITYYPSNQPSQ